MLATFVIGLREGLEAALIVGIIAAFLNQEGSSRQLRYVWLGVGSALTICLAVGIVLQIISADLPQKQQEGLETVIGAVAVAMVTYMAIWMRRHSRDLKGQLEGAAGSALAHGSARALIAMAFLAVLREGLETAVFLLAAFNASGNGVTAGLGALLGVLVAVVLGWGIYRGGVKVNLSKFFRATGLVLVLVAAGLVMTAFHTAHEAGWIDAGQGRVVDLSWLVRNGSVQASLITGVLGWQAKPTQVEVIAWLVYLVPLGLYVGWKPGKPVPWRGAAWAGAALATACAAAAVAFAAAAPSKPPVMAETRWTTPITGSSSARVTADGFSAAALQEPVTGSTTWTTANASESGSAERAGIPVQVLTRTTSGPVTADAGLPSTVTADELREWGGGRLPIGIRADDLSGALPVSYQQRTTQTLWRDPLTGRLLDARSQTSVQATVRASIGPVALGTVSDTTRRATQSAVGSAAAADRDQRDQLSRAESWGSDYPVAFGVAAFLLALGAAVALVVHRRGGAVARRRASAATPPAAAVAPGEPASRETPRASVAAGPGSGRS